MGLEVELERCPIFPNLLFGRYGEAKCRNHKPLQRSYSLQEHFICQSVAKKSCITISVDMPLMLCGDRLLNPSHTDKARKLLYAIDPGEDVGIGRQVNLSVWSQRHIGKHRHIGDRRTV